MLLDDSASRLDATAFSTLLDVISPFLAGFCQRTAMPRPTATDATAWSVDFVETVELGGMMMISEVFANVDLREPGFWSFCKST